MRYVPMRVRSEVDRHDKARHHILLDPEFGNPKRVDDGVRFVRFRRRDIHRHGHARRQVQIVVDGLLESGIAEFEIPFVADRFHRHRRRLRAVIFGQDVVAEQTEHEHEDGRYGRPPCFERAVIVDGRTCGIARIAHALPIANREIEQKSVDVHEDWHAEERHEPEQPIDVGCWLRRLGQEFFDGKDDHAPHIPSALK